tara:strand:- start:406 stop:576 length:171 start_codon:yes stop_codon:yes gene_type:complete
MKYKKPTELGYGVFANRDLHPIDGERVILKTITSEGYMTITLNKDAQEKLIKFINK